MDRFLGPGVTPTGHPEGNILDIIVSQNRLNASRVHEFLRKILKIGSGLLGVNCCIKVLGLAEPYPTTS